MQHKSDKMAENGAKIFGFLLQQKMSENTLSKRVRALKIVR